MNTDFYMKKAETDDQLRQIADLAEIIWNEHFTPIIGKKQVDYMIEKSSLILLSKDRSQTGTSTTRFLTKMNSAGTPESIPRKTTGSF